MLLLITSDNEIIGYLAFAVEPEHLYISKLYLLASARGKGHTRTIFKWLTTKATAHDKDTLFLHVNRSNTRAISVYQHFGFDIQQSVDTKFGAYILNDYWMAKSI